MRSYGPKGEAGADSGARAQDGPEPAEAFRQRQRQPDRLSPRARRLFFGPSSHSILQRCRHGNGSTAALPTPHRQRDDRSRRLRQDDAVHGRGRRGGDVPQSLEEQPAERLRAWYHNGEDNIEEF